jgi:hypothetical protein
MKYTILITLILALSTNMGAQDRLYNQSKSFSIESAKGWIDKSSGDVINLENRTGEFHILGDIKIAAYPSNGESLDSLWDLYVLKGFPNSFDNYEFIQSWDSEINEINTKWIEFRFSKNGNLFKIRVYMLVENDQMFYITWTALDADFEFVEKDFNFMTNSLIIN